MGNSQKNLKTTRRAFARDEQARITREDALKENCSAQDTQRSEIMSKLNLEIHSQKQILEHYTNLKEHQKNLENEIPTLDKQISSGSKAILAHFEDFTNLQLEVTKEAQFVATRDNKKKVIDPSQPVLAQILSI